MKMLKPVYTNRFEKDIRLAVRRNLDMEKLKTVIREIINQEKLDDVYRNHVLVGNYTGRYECHIQPDWLLIYSDRGDHWSPVHPTGQNIHLPAIWQDLCRYIPIFLNIPPHCGRYDHDRIFAT